MLRGRDVKGEECLCCWCDVEILEAEDFLWLVFHQGANNKEDEMIPGPQQCSPLVLTVSMSIRRL